MANERARVEAFWRERYARIRLTADGSAATWLDYSSDAQRGQKLQAQTFALVTEALGVVDGKRVLDAGCGWGEFLMSLSALGAKTVGLDLVDATIEALRAARPDLEWAAGSFLDAVTLERLGSFDRIVAIESFQCAGPPLESLRMLWSAIAPGGRLVVIAPNAACPIVAKAVAALAGNLSAVEPGELVAAVRALPGLTRYALRGLTFATDQWLAPYSASAWAQDATEWPTANRLLLVCER